MGSIEPCTLPADALLPDCPRWTGRWRQSNTPAVGESRGQGLGDEKPGAAVPRGDGGGVIEERPGVEDLEDFRVRVPDGVPVGLWKQPEGPGQLTAPGRVDCLQQPPVAGHRKPQLIGWQLSGQCPRRTRTARYSSMTIIRRAGRRVSSRRLGRHR